MSEPFVEMLRGAKNNLGRTEEVVDLVLGDPGRANEVYDCFFQPDEWVRLRAASVSKRLWRADMALFAPFIAGWIERVSAIDQPSAQWTFAQMCAECDAEFDEPQRDRASEILVGYLTTTDDWIVLNASMATLATWASTRPELATRIRPLLTTRASDSRKSVARRAEKALAEISS